MSESINLQFPDIAGDVSGHTAFVRHESTGALLNTGGDAITEFATGFWSFTLAEARAENKNYYVTVYSGSSETAENLVYNGILRAGMLMVDAIFEATNKTFIRGTVGASSPTTSTFTPSAISTEASVLNQWRGRILVFDNDTTTAALRGQATDITGSSAAALPLLTFTALTNAPVSGDKFSIL